jgi:hypothetical protein
LERTEDKHILVKRKNLEQTIENPIRLSFENWIAASERAKALRQLGYKVTVPAPHVRRPQFILISRAR